MKRWNEYIKQLKELVETLQKELEPYLDTKHRHEKQLQLQSVEKSINTLQKNGTAIPEELRELKLKLMSELELFKEAEKTSETVQKIVEPFIVKEQKKSRNKTVNKTVSSSGITLRDLIIAKVLPVPLTIERQYKGKRYQAVINQDGTITLTLDGLKKTFNSPTSAAVFCTGISTNGWIWWQVRVGSELKSLDYYRKKVKKL